MTSRIEEVIAEYDACTMRTEGRCMGGCTCLAAQIAAMRCELSAWLDLVADFPGAIAPVDDDGGYVYVDEWEAYVERLNQREEATRTVLDGEQA